ncbi:phospholipase D family protein [Luteimonas sp. SX5]|uniref:Phospholipase D family protein n=1 Tax=Luteimonas galliterrae TaxID=2940486 RepID=A0ABT0MMI8_9GAMM|nr:phospholipase D family protein [Luteimonas galliterrae]MCL1635818.1 phospholipase D family protein [Luteimonas galliterrae]
MSWRRAWLAAMLALSCGACATMSQGQRDRATQIAAAARSTQIDCAAADRCAQPSPLHDLGGRALLASGPDAPRHYALILDRGPQALLARINLLRSARSKIDLQTYIFDEDDAGRLVLDELLAAARRGVKVRVLVDQLSALKSVDTLAALAGAHVNFSIRIYNPVLNRARISYPQYLVAGLCCFRRLNQRMHSKLLLIDDEIGITGGRNYQDDYYDWSPAYNFRDRDVLIAGPVAHEMAANFEAFWNAFRTKPVEQLGDVGKRLLRDGVPPLKPTQYEQPARAEAMSEDASDPALVEQALASQALPVGKVEFIADLPQKHRRDRKRAEAAMHTTPGLNHLIASAQQEVLLQTPYLVLSKPAQQLFRDMHERPSPPRIVISTNSLAATDSFITYALSHKYKRRYLRDFGFEIYEFKPFPASAPIDLTATGAPLPADIAPLSLRGQAQSPPEEAAVAVAGSGGGRSGGRRNVSPRETPLQREFFAGRYLGNNANQPVPLKRVGVRIGLHAKSMVVDNRIGVIGTHNFDPRGDRYNTESAVVIDDPAFAQALAASIRGDIAPENSWVIARRDKPPVFSGLEYSLAKVSEHLPIFDLWPVRYATSYEFKPGPQCPLPLSPNDPRFRGCYEPVGDYPEVDLGFKWLSTRIFTAFGAGLAPIL